MNRQQALLFVFLLLFFNNLGNAQVNFSIVLKDYADSSVLLTSYYGDKIKLVDTAHSNEGVYSFGNQSYPAGIYILADPSKKKLFEFIINNETGFSFYAESISDGNIEVKGSQENKIFLELLQLRKNLYQTATLISEKESITNTSHLTSVELDQQFDSLQYLLQEEEKRIIEHHPELFIAKLITARRKLNIPQTFLDDTLRMFQYQKKHFWDGFDLNDARFLRTPLLDQKMKTYFDRFVYLNPDSTILAIDTIVSKARPSEEMISYLLWYFISEYQNPKYMGFDKVFLHLTDNYFLKEEIANTTPSILEKLKERSDNLKPLLIGKPAPNLILIDTNNQFISFNSLKSEYTLLMFWDYNCDVCENEIEELEALLNLTNYKISVYAINTNGNLDEWKRVIIKQKMDWCNVNGSKGMTKDYHHLYNINGTPRLFLLDQQKKIIAKHFKVAQLIPIIENSK